MRSLNINTSREDFPHLEPFFKQTEKRFGFLPEGFFDMARIPRLIQTVGAFIELYLTPDHISRELSLLISYGCSISSGNEYCALHAAKLAETHGVSADKINAVSEYETSLLFTNSERAALRIAEKTSRNAGALTDEDFDTLKKYFYDEAIVEIVYVVSFFGFLNKWYSVLMREAEPETLSFLKENPDLFAA